MPIWRVLRPRVALGTVELGVTGFAMTTMDAYGPGSCTWVQLASDTHYRGIGTSRYLSGGKRSIGTPARYRPWIMIHIANMRITGT